MSNTADTTTENVVPNSVTINSSSSGVQRAVDTGNSAPTGSAQANYHSTSTTNNQSTNNTTYPNPPAPN
eukprot:12472694-Ditylum_brightwellii.AAC.1